MDENDIPKHEIEEVAKAMFCQHYARELWEHADCREKFLEDARVALVAAAKVRKETDDLCAHHSPQLSAAKEAFGTLLRDVQEERDALRAALSQVMGAIDNSRLSPKPGCGVGGQTTDAILRASTYNGVDAWTIECARSALYADYSQKEES